MFIHIITGIWGQEVWQTSILQLLSLSPADLAVVPPFFLKYLDMNLGPMVVYFYSTLLCLVLVYTILNTLIFSKDKSRTVLEFFSFALLVLMELTWSNMSIYAEYSGIILVNFGIVASTLVCKIIVCSVTKVLVL